MGITILPCYIHKAETEQGRIVVLLPGHEIEKLKLYLIHQHRDYMPLRMKLFQQFITNWARQRIAAST